MRACRRQPIRLWLLLAAPAASLPCQRPEDSAARCGSCHVTVHAEWHDSAHARAYVDPVFQKALAVRTRPDLCLPCHVPQSALDRLGQLPRARQQQLDDGVACAACHRRGDAVHGPTGPATTAHATVADPAFLRRGSVGLCTGCHDLRIADVLPLGRDFIAAGLLDDGESCVGCHMDPVQRAPAQDPATGQDNVPVRRGRSHRLLGPADPLFCASAFLLRVERDARGTALVVANGAGHGVPGLARLRTFDFRLQWLDRTGRALGADSFQISWQHRLLAEEHRRVPLRMVDGAVAVRVQVDHIFAGQKPATVIDRTLELP